MNTTMANHPQQQFGQGLGNGGDGPPNERQHGIPQRGHYAESLRPIVVRDHQKSADGMRFGEYQEPGHHVGYQNSSYGAEYGRVPETYGPRSSFANSRHAYDNGYLAQAGPYRRTDERERSPLRESSPYNGSYRDRAPPTVGPAREAPGLESAADRAAKLPAQRLAENSSSSAPVGQPLTWSTQAQGAQVEAHHYLERRLLEQEQRHQAAIAQLQQQVSALDTRHEELARMHFALIEQLNEATQNGANLALAPAPRAHRETAAEPLLGDESAEYQSIDMLSSQEIESLESAPDIGQQLADTGWVNMFGLTGISRVDFTKAPYIQPPPRRD